MSKVQLNRQPCPGRIFEDLGNGFAIGCVGGSLFYFFKGFFNAPRGQRIISGFRHVSNRAGLLGGSFAMWGGIFSGTDCCLITIRRMDDWKNAVVAGAITGGFLAIRSGVSVAMKQAAIGGMILLMIEGVSVLFSAFALRQQHAMMREMMAAEQARRDQMVRMGGENAYDTEYKKDVQKEQEKLEDELSMDAGIQKKEEDEEGMGQSLLRKFSF